MSSCLVASPRSTARERKRGPAFRGPTRSSVGLGVFFKALHRLARVADGRVVFAHRVLDFGDVAERDTAQRGRPLAFERRDRFVQDLERARVIA